ncbi:MAG: hypothetical protein ACYDER_18760 [Ktedonobacteraceae bacterium]
MSKFDNELDDFPDRGSENEFELEITDLAPDEEAGRSVAIVAEGLRVLSRVRDTSNELVEQGKQRLDDAREWLLEEKPEQRIIERTAYSEFELEMTNLPPEAEQSGQWLQFFERVRGRVPFNRRLRRISIAVAIVLLTVIFMLSSLPDLRDAIASFFGGGGQPTQTTNSSSSFIFSSDNSITNSNVEVQGQGPIPATVTASGTVGTTWSTNATPGPKWPLPPAAMPTNCPAGPMVNDSHTVGSTPIWITGFSGPRATIHLPNTPSRSIPQWHGWAVHLVITVPTDYPDPVTITGSDILYGRLLYFQADPNPSLTPILILNPAQPSGLHSIVDGEQGISWNVTMYVYSSGCYMINTAWPDGEWNIQFAAGL